MEKISHTLLLVCLNHELAEAQRMILEEHGYHVRLAGDLRELDRISKNHQISCAVLGQDLGPGMKHAVAALLCKNLPAIAILEEYSTSPVIEEAEHIPAGDTSEVLATIDDLLLPYGQRHTNHVRSTARSFVERARELVKKAKSIRENRQARAEAKRQRETAMKKSRRRA